MLNVSIVVGNPKPDSRTLQVARSLVESTLEPRSYDLTVIDLAHYADVLFAWPSEQLDALNQQIAGADLVVVASPTYKATYTGLLKAFMDRYPNKGLSGVVALLMTGADLSHAMGMDVHLRPLLVELGACVPTAGLYFDMHNMDRLDEVVRDWASEHGVSLRSFLPGTDEALVSGRADARVKR
ncbi:NAD(P)H-dependent oxidoreductase [Prescottella defluvii]|nr:NAD(P)H-dependent oxidoreductase [Prescottella defluvii]